MPDERSYREDSPAVQAHLNISQSVIQRMASNSASSKAWCITLVSAVLVVTADKGKAEYVMIAAIPTLLFCVLDTYYLALERCYRESYNGFINKLHEGRIGAVDLFAVKPTGSVARSFFTSIASFSIWPFYLTLAFMIWIGKRIVAP